MRGWHPPEIENRDPQVQVRTCSNSPAMIFFAANMMTAWKAHIHHFVWPVSVTSLAETRSALLRLREIVFREGTMARTRNRVTGVVVSDGKLLLIHRFRAGEEYWVFPGGGVEEGEDLEMALHREMLEETGRNLVSFERIFDQPDDHGNTCIFYTCTLEPGKLEFGGPEKEAQSTENQFTWVWVALDQVAAMSTVYPRPFQFLEWLKRKTS